MLRLYEAGVIVMRLSRLLPLLAVAALALVPAARADVLINIDKAKQRMTVVVDGEPRFIWPVSTGMADYDTPTGEFQPFRMERTHFSREWDDAPMPYSIFFTQQGHAIHGSYDVKHLGRPASHGCVRLSRANPAILFALVKEQGVKNAQVTLSGEIPEAAVARRDRNYGVPDEAPPPTRRYRQRAVRNWREYNDGPRYFYYRAQPFYAPRYVDRPRGLPFFHPYAR
jgi:hypothetical protein